MISSLIGKKFILSIFVMRMKDWCIRLFQLQSLLNDLAQFPRLIRMVSVSLGKSRKTATLLVRLKREAFAANEIAEIEGVLTKWRFERGNDGMSFGKRKRMQSVWRRPVTPCARFLQMPVSERCDDVICVLDLEEVKKANMNATYYQVYSGRVVVPSERAVVVALEHALRMTKGKGRIVSTTQMDMDLANRVLHFHFPSKFASEWPVSFASNASELVNMVPERGIVFSANASLMEEARKLSSACFVTTQNLSYVDESGTPGICEFKQVKLALICKVRHSLFFFHVLLKRIKDEQTSNTQYIRLSRMTPENSSCFFGMRDMLLVEFENWKPAFTNAKGLRFESEEFEQKRFMLALCMRQLVGKFLYRLICDLVLFEWAKSEFALPLLCKEYPKVCSICAHSIIVGNEALAEAAKERPLGRRNERVFKVLLKHRNLDSYVSCSAFRRAFRTQVLEKLLSPALVSGPSLLGICPFLQTAENFQAPPPAQPCACLREAGVYCSMCY